MWIVLLVVAGVAAWTLLAGYFRGGQVVDAARIRRGALEVVLPVTGTFETRSVDLSFEIPGRLAQGPVREGSQVRQGDALASIEDQELRAVGAQAQAGAAAAESEAARARAAVDAARAQTLQAEAAFRAAQANLAQLRAGPRSAELRQAEAAVEAARSALDQAQRNLAIQEQLLRDGAVSRAQVDAARAQFEAAQAQYRQAVAQRDVLRAGARPEAVTFATEQVRQAEAARQAAQANVRQAQAMAAAARSNVTQAQAAARAARARAERAHVRAPFDGIVSRVILNPGAQVAPGIPVVSLVTSSGWVNADVDEADIGKVQVGQAARITADAYPGRKLLGRVTRIGGQVDVRLGSRTVRVRIDLESPAQMRSGTSVDVDIILRTVADGLLAPLEAVIPGENGLSYVYLIQDSVLRRRQVQTGDSNDTFVAIREGVREGDLVAIADPASLRDSLRIRVHSVQ